jgi:hypothetical protein
LFWESHILHGVGLISIKTVQCNFIFVLVQFWLAYLVPILKFQFPFHLVELCKSRPGSSCAKLSSQSPTSKLSNQAEEAGKKRNTNATGEK